MRECIVTGSWKEEALNLCGKMSWRDIARKLNVPRSTVSDFLRKTTKDPGTDTLPENMSIERNKSIQVVKIETSPFRERNSTHLFIGDTQCKPNRDLSYCSAIGEFIADKMPECIIHAGDHFDFPSLSSYDKGKRSMEGRRVADDLVAGLEGMRRILYPIHRRQLQDQRWKPRMVFLRGNHEHRQTRHIEANPELDGFMSKRDLQLEEMGWEVHDFLEVVTIDGISYSHYFANPLTGKALTGTAANMLKTIGTSFTMGHRQVLDTATRFIYNGTQQWGLVCGSCYDFEEDYKGPQGNDHFRGVVMKHEVSNGNYLPMFVSLDYLKKRYL